METTDGNHRWKPPMETTDGNHRWKPPMETTDGNHRWKPPMETTDGNHRWKSHVPCRISLSSLHWSKKLYVGIFPKPKRIWLHRRGSVAQFLWPPTQEVGVRFPNLPTLEKCAEGIRHATFFGRLSRMTGKPWLRVKWGGSPLKDLESSRQPLQCNCKNLGTGINNTIQYNSLSPKLLIWQKTQQSTLPMTATVSTISQSN